MFKSTKLRVIVAASAVSAIAIGAFGFANSNTVPETHVGIGTGEISGYTVDDVAYTFDPADPAVITDVEFTLSPAGATEAWVQFELEGATTSAWEDCTFVVDTWQCELAAPVDSEAVVGLTVFATDSSTATP